MEVLDTNRTTLCLCTQKVVVYHHYLKYLDILDIFQDKCRVWVWNQEQRQRFAEAKQMLLKCRLCRLCSIRLHISWSLQCWIFEYMQEFPNRYEVTIIQRKSRLAGDFPHWLILLTPCVLTASQLPTSTSLQINALQDIYVFYVQIGTS